MSISVLSYCKGGARSRRIRINRTAPSSLTEAQIIILNVERDIWARSSTTSKQVEDEMEKISEREIKPGLVAIHKQKRREKQSSSVDDLRVRKFYDAKEKVMIFHVYHSICKVLFEKM